MNTIWITNLVVLLGLMFGSYVDLKKREVPDYLNFFMIFLGVFFGISGSIYALSWWPIFLSLSGLALGYLFGALMFYTGQWGGGDAKMVMAIGALHGINIISWIKTGEIPLFITILVTIILAGSIYGLFYLMFLFLKNFKKSIREFKKITHTKKVMKIRKWILLLVFLLLVTIFIADYFLIKMLILVMAIMVFVGHYLILVGKVVEKVCMIKEVSPKELTEGDWIVKDVVVDKKKICGPKDLGISLEQIALLKKLKVKSVIMKDGIPFLPGFLLGYILVLIFGNWLVFLI